MDVAMSDDRSGTGGTGAAPVRSARRLAPAAVALLLAACGGDGPTENGNGTVEGIDLSVGEVAVRAAGGEVLRLELPADRVHEVAAQVNSGPSPGVVPMRLKVAPTAGASGSAAPSSSVSPLRGQDLLDERWTRAADLAGRLKIQENAKRLLRRWNVPPARRDPLTEEAVEPGALQPRFTSMLPNSTPSLGDTVEFWYPVQPDFNIACSTDSAEVVTAEVRSVGQRAVMVQDTSVDESLLGESMNYDSLAQVFDDEIFGVDETYFGQSTDIDGNGRIYVLFTTRVNDLTEPGDEGIVSGFFLPTDLADSGDPDKEGSENTPSCQNSSAWESSNEAEVLYLLAPDPNGDFGKEVSVSQAKRSAVGTSAHEFQHLLNTGNRIIKQSGSFADLEDTWLDEALSHLAEEVVGLSQTGDPVRDNLSLARVVEGQDEVDAFNTFHLPNFARLAAYMRGPDTTEVLAIRDPQGAESLRMRGFVWVFLRWLTDQEATASVAPVPGSGEEAFIRDLAQADGGLEAGVANVEATTGRSWTTLLEDFGLVPAVDDTVAGVDPRVTLPTWDLRDVFLGLHENEGSGGSFPQPYPLAYTSPGFSSTSTVDFEVDEGTQKYFRFDGSGAASSVTLELTDQSGAPLSTSSGALLLIVRTR